MESPMISRRGRVTPAGNGEPVGSPTLDEPPMAISPVGAVPPAFIDPAPSVPPAPLPAMGAPSRPVLGSPTAPPLPEAAGMVFDPPAPEEDSGGASPEPGGADGEASLQANSDAHTMKEPNPVQTRLTMTPQYCLKE